MMRRRTAIVAATGLILALLAACQARRTDPETGADQDLGERMARIQADLQAMQAELGQDLAHARGTGRGAYARGPLSISGTETVLEQLHRTEQTLQEAQNTLNDHSRAIIALRQENSAKADSIASLSAKAERLDRAEMRRITAIQERDATRESYDALEERLLAVELSLLERERDYYDLIGEILRLEPGHTQEFANLQQRLKEQARRLPVPGADAGSDEPLSRARP